MFTFSLISHPCQYLKKTVRKCSAQFWQGVLPCQRRFFHSFTVFFEMAPLKNDHICFQNSASVGAHANGTFSTLDWVLPNILHLFFYIFCESFIPELQDKSWMRSRLLLELRTKICLRNAAMIACHSTLQIRKFKISVSMCGSGGQRCHTARVYCKNGVFFFSGRCNAFGEKTKRRPAAERRTFCASFA